MNIIILGPQGSGKGTQAKLLAKKFNLEHLETGKILREIAATDTSLGKKVASRINRGFLVNSKILSEVFSQYLKEVPKNKGVVFDGVPRSMPQVKIFETALKKAKRKLTTGFFIWISRKETFKRLEKRGREDDEKETIEKRLKQYYQRTLPVVRFYYLKDKMIEINGEQPIKKVFTDILEYLPFVQPH